MSMVNKQPYITPEMISKWNAGGGRMYTFDVSFTPSQFSPWGNEYYTYTIINIGESIRDKNIIATFKTTTSAAVVMSLIQDSTRPDNQLQLNFARPTMPNINVDGKVYIYVMD